MFLKQFRFKKTETRTEYFEHPNILWLCGDELRKFFHLGKHVAGEYITVKIYSCAGKSKNRVELVYAPASMYGFTINDEGVCFATNVDATVLLIFSKLIANYNRKYKNHISSLYIGLFDKNGESVSLK